MSFFLINEPWGGGGGGGGLAIMSPSNVTNKYQEIHGKFNKNQVFQ